MASTYTLNTGIELIANGEQSGTWGTTTNVNLEIIDRLTNGVGAITLSGTTHTLTTTDGTLSDGQFKVLVFGGSPSGTNTVTISPNDQDKQYFILNSSGQSVVLTQGSGGNVTIANGKSAIVFADGGGAGAAVTDLTATFVPAGALLVANNLSDLADAPTALTNLGVTATAAELNVLDGITSTTAELNVLDGITSTTAELNILDGVTATAAELNILDGVTATTAELNILDGVTATTAEINKLDGVSGDVVGTTDTQTLTNKTLSGADNTVTVDGTVGVGFLSIPQNSQSAAYTLVLSDAGKHILHPSADTTVRTFTIPANGSVAFPVGTAITFINQDSAGELTIAITTDTMRLAGDGATGSRTLDANGVATCIKVTSTEWIISGVGLT
jgi:hypothetical protein